jgi:hypothetical protein
MTIIAVAAVVVGLWSVLGGSSTPVREVVVQPGDSTLSIALREFPDMDPARAVELISADNNLADLTPGATLEIPAQR